MTPKSNSEYRKAALNGLHSSRHSLAPSALQTLTSDPAWNPGILHRSTPERLGRPGKAYCGVPLGHPWPPGNISILTPLVSVLLSVLEVERTRSSQKFPSYHPRDPALENGLWFTVSWLHHMPSLVSGHDILVQVFPRWSQSPWRSFLPGSVSSYPFCVEATGEYDGIQSADSLFNAATPADHVMPSQI